MTCIPLVTIDARMLFSSGIGVYLRNLLPRVLATPGVRFALMGRPQDFARLEWAMASGVTRIPVASPIYSISQQFEMPRLIPRDTALYWAPHYDMPLLRKGKLLVTIHDVAHVAMPEIFSGLLKQAYARSMLQVVRRSAAHIMYVSEFSRNEFARLVGAPSGATSVEYLGLDESWRDPRWRTLPRPRARSYIVYVGNVKPHKNLKGLLAAFDRIKNRVPHDLLLIGQVDGFLTGDNAVTARLRQGDPRIVLAGPLSDEAVRIHVAHAALLVLPSFYEGFGLPPLEAMACGCPVAVARAASIPEMCGNAALYFDPRDPGDMARAIVQILDDPQTADALRQKGLVQAARYRWEESTANVMRVIESCISQP